MLHLYSSSVVPLSLCCLTAIAPLLSLLLLRRSRSCFCYAVAHAIASAVAPMSLRCCSAVAPLSHRCRFAISQLSLCCPSAAASVSPLLLLYLLLSLLCHCCYRSCCHSTVTPAVDLVSLWCRSAIVPLSVRRLSVVTPLPLLSLLLSLLLLLLMSLHCCLLDCSRSLHQEAESG